MNHLTQLHFKARGEIYRISGLADLINGTKTLVCIFTSNSGSYFPDQGMIEIIIKQCGTSLVYAIFLK